MGWGPSHIQALLAIPDPEDSALFHPILPQAGTSKTWGKDKTHTAPQYPEQWSRYEKDVPGVRCKGEGEKRTTKDRKASAGRTGDVPVPWGLGALPVNRPHA